MSTLWLKAGIEIAGCQVPRTSHFRTLHCCCGSPFASFNSAAGLPESPLGSRLLLAGLLLPSAMTLKLSKPQPLQEDGHGEQSNAECGARQPAGEILECGSFTLESRVFGLFGK